MAGKELVNRIVEYHRKEAEEECHREIGDDAVYDQITWENIEPFLPEEGRILDAGGGVGLWARKIVKTSKCRVELLDITGELLQTAKRRIMRDFVGQHIEMLQGDIRSIPHPDKSFDFILCEGDPISICGDPERAVWELSRVLKPKCHLVAGVDSTFYRAFKMLSQGKALDRILGFLQTGISPAEEEANFDSKSFTPIELISLLQKQGLRTVRVVGKPIGPSANMLDPFLEVLPQEKRREIFENKTQKEELDKMLKRIYKDPYVSGIGSHLQVVAVKKEE
jgi:ubiquinone/menaquinone biosynthesis C-methylase UbiE